MLTGHLVKFVAMFKTIFKSAQGSRLQGSSDRILLLAAAVLPVELASRCGVGILEKKTHISLSKKKELL